MGRVREESQKRKSEEKGTKKIKESLRKSEKMKMQVGERLESRESTMFIPMIRGSGGSKSRRAKAAGAEPAGQRKDEKLHATAAGSTFSFPGQKGQSYCR